MRTPDTGRLTETDRLVITQALELAGAKGGVDDLSRVTGRQLSPDEPAVVLAGALGRAQWLLLELVDIVDRLAGEINHLRSEMHGEAGQ